MKRKIRRYYSILPKRRRKKEKKRKKGEKRNIVTKESTNLVRTLVEHSADVDVVAKYRVTGVHAVPTFLLAAWNEASVSENHSPERKRKDIFSRQYQIN